jgi:iron complex outermembrane receptor protein
MQGQGATAHWLLFRTLAIGGDTMRRITILLSGVGIAALSTAWAPVATPAAAQEVAQLRLEEIVVTSRKREESLLDVPMAISAISRSQLEDLNLKNMADIAKMSPGLFYTDYGANRADRLYRSYIIRGLAVNNSNNFSDGAILFVDGAPVVSGNMPGTLDIERVEILKGPQAAYFGRNTFSGAISVTTREPRNTWGGSAMAEYSSYNSSDVAASVDGPLVKDKVLVRISGEHQTQGGQYKNALDKSQRLGGQKTTSVSGMLKFTPTDALTVKVASSYFVYSDDPGAQVRLIGPQLTCDPGKTGRNTWICGTAPRVYPNQLVFKFLDQRWQDLTLPRSFFQPSLTDHAGLESRNFHINGSISYTFANNWVLESTTSFDQTKAATISDEWYDPNRANQFFGAIPGVRPTWNWLYLIERRFRDFSQEVRVSSDKSSRLRWTLGGNYIKFSTLGDVLGDVPLGAPLVLPGALGEARTWAGFGGVYYDVLSNLEAGFEARYQSDFVRNTPNGTTATPGTPISGTWNSFAPRVSLKYKPTTDTTIYALWSRGTRPGTFNSTLIPGAQPPAVQQQIVALTGAQLQVAQEKLDNFEIGAKARFLDGRGLVTLTGYTGKISNQQIAQGYTITTPSVNVGTVLVNRGTTKLSGIELELAFQVTDELKLEGAFALNNTKITAGADTSVAPLTGGNTNVIGNRLPNAPKTQGNIQATYTRPLTDSLNWYVGAEYIYVGGKFAETANLLSTGAQNLVNARLGVSNDTLRLELWGRNLFANKTPDLISVAFDYNSFIGNALQIALPKRPTYGVRVNYNF